MDRFQREALDRHITGNYGEDQFRSDGADDGWDDDGPEEPTPEENLAAGSETYQQQFSDHEHFDDTYERLVRQHGHRRGANLFTSIYLGEARDV